jgi:fructan beta-fructosidase
VSAIDLQEGPGRPLLHFTPRRNWINDPNGLVWFEGEYHLFFQYNPEGTTWGNMSWGHAVSPDLVTWTELPVALTHTENEFAFSGSVVVDRLDTSGLGEPGRPAMVALYTAHDPTSGHQAQAVAWSLDRGRTWTRSDANPVLDIGSTAFRDPKVFWYTPGGYWVMAVALPEEQVIRFYRSDDLHAWVRLSDFTCPGPSGLWECPDLFELPVEDRPGLRQWVLVFSLDGKDTHGWSGTQYVVGSFDGTTFTPDVPGREAVRLDHGADCYAAVTFTDAPDGQRILLGWMNNWAYAERTPAREFRGAMTLPRLLALEETGGEMRLLQRPIRITDDTSPAYVVSDLRIGPGATPLGEVDSDAQVIAVELHPEAARDVGVCVRVGAHERTVVGYDTETATLYVDRSRSGQVGFADQFAGVHRAPAQIGPEGGLALTIVVDRCSVEVFTQDGSCVITEQIFPGPDSTGIELFACGGSAVVDLSVTALDRTDWCTR